MFGAICANRPVQTNLQILSPTQFVFTIPPDPPFTHIVVFLLPDQTLPLDTGAAVYIRFPPSPTQPSTTTTTTQQAAEFQFLGAIANDKQSAIFRVNRNVASSAITTNNNNGDGQMQQQEDQDAMIDSSTTTTTPPTPNPNPTDPTQTITLGISLEPLNTISTLLAQQQQQQLQPSSIPPQTPTTTTAALAKPPPSTKVLAQRIIQNAFNYLASFAVSVPAGPGGGGGEEMVPLRAFRDWWTRFEKRIALDEGFLDREVV